MDAFTTLDGLVVPLDRANVDTDAIIPKQFLKSIKRSGFGPNLFDEWRYLDVGEPGQGDVPLGYNTERPLNADFVLNQPRYSGAQVLLARDNFGCGSSREHAVWALLDYGIRVVIAPSFADIFYNNCFKNGVLPFALSADEVDRLFKEISANEGYRLQIDLAAQHVTLPSGEMMNFEIDNFRKECLLQGLDEIGLSLKHAAAVREYEAKRKQNAPWLFAS